MTTDAEFLRAAHAILAEIIAAPSVPHGLRRLAAHWCQQRQDAVRLERSLDDGLALAEIEHHRRLIREGQS